MRLTATCIAGYSRRYRTEKQILRFLVLPDFPFPRNFFPLLTSLYQNRTQLMYYFLGSLLRLQLSPLHWELLGRRDCGLFFFFFFVSSVPNSMLGTEQTFNIYLLNWKIGGKELTFFKCPQCAKNWNKHFVDIISLNVKNFISWL